ncbi:MAG TPA: type II secretion system protein [Candidatus Paceibacterota bacterium]|nr:type II secretion system protein [Candidatus Paceibacterota bacterium]
MNRSRGFTLIELLVVIAIIGLLSSIVLASLNTARLKARDAQRLSDLHNIRLALELYYDANGSYPSSSNGWLYSCTSSQWSILQTALAPYMKVPVDPKNSPCSGPWTQGNYVYAYLAGPAWPGKYDLVAELEDSSNQQRCGVHPWYYHTSGNEVSWCGSYTTNLIADH